MDRMSRAVRAVGQDEWQATGHAHAWADRRHLGLTGEPDELTRCRPVVIFSGVGCGPGFRGTGSCGGAYDRLDLGCAPAVAFVTCSRVRVYGRIRGSVNPINLFPTEATGGPTLRGIRGTPRGCRTTRCSGRGGAVGISCRGIAETPRR